MLDYEKDPPPEHWKTINGAKVHLDKNGKYDGGAGGKFNGNYHFGGSDWKEKKAHIQSLTNIFNQAVAQKQAQANAQGNGQGNNQGNGQGNAPAQNVASKATQGGGGNGTISTWDKISGEHTTEDDIKSTNPNFSTGEPYQINCQRCVQAYELRRRGYAVVAKPKDKIRTDDPVRAGLECFAQPQPGESFSDAAENMYKFPVNQSDIKRELKAAPDGSRYVILCTWKGRKREMHVFIAEKENGKVKYIDPQSGCMDVESYLRIARSGWFGYCRIDDKPLTNDDSILDETAERECYGSK